MNQSIPKIGGKEITLEDVNEWGRELGKAGIDINKGIFMFGSDQKMLSKKSLLRTFRRSKRSERIWASKLKAN